MKKISKIFMLAVVTVLFTTVLASCGNNTADFKNISVFENTLSGYVNAFRKISGLTPAGYVSTQNIFDKLAGYNFLLDAEVGMEDGTHTELYIVDENILYSKRSDTMQEQYEEYVTTTTGNTYSRDIIDNDSFGEWYKGSFETSVINTCVVLVDFVNVFLTADYDKSEKSTKVVYTAKNPSEISINYLGDDESVTVKSSIIEISKDRSGNDTLLLTAIYETSLNDEVHLSMKCTLGGQALTLPQV